MVEQAILGATTGCRAAGEVVETDDGLGVTDVDSEQHGISWGVQSGSMSRPMSMTAALLVRPPIEMQSTPAAE